MISTENGKYRIAVPSMSPGGMEAERSGHFGRCDCFTLVDVEDGKPVSVSILENPPHEHGGCLSTVTLLAGQKVDVIVVQGIGMRPLMGFREQGIEVFQGVGEQVQPAVEALIAGQLPVFDVEAVCGHH